jgi:hypothetical protein
MTFVTVYRFRLWNPDRRDFDIWPRLGTRAAIEKAGGKIVEGSAMEVPAGDLDDDGFALPRMEAE